MQSEWVLRQNAYYEYAATVLPLDLVSENGKEEPTSYSGYMGWNHGTEKRVEKRKITMRKKNINKRKIT